MNTFSMICSVLSNETSRLVQYLSLVCYFCIYLLLSINVALPNPTNHTFNTILALTLVPEL